MPAATDDEITKMCDSLVRLRGEVDGSSAEELAKTTKERIDREEKRLKDWKARDMKGWDDELAAKLAATEDEEEKKKIQEEYTKKKEVSASKHDPGIAAIAEKRKTAMEEAKKKAAENKAAWDAAVSECVAQAKKEGVSQKVAQCRITAQSTDEYWNKCR
jgi:colicin import membrane protein